MLKTRLIAATAVAALALGFIAAPAFAATTMPKPTPVAYAKAVHHNHYVSGKIARISYKHRTVTLTNGKTYKVARILPSYKVGRWVRLHV
jgi:hypothetical protein